MTFQLPVTVHYQLCCDIMSYVILFDSIQYTKSCPLICIFSYQATQSSSSSPYSKAPALVNTATLYADKELNNSLVLSLDWLNKTNRQVVIFRNRQRTNLLIRLSSLLVAQICRTDWHTYWHTVSVEKSRPKMFLLFSHLIDEKVASFLTYIYEKLVKSSVSFW